jgi:prevent-host-death family protein
MRSVTIADLKNNLSRYLREVRRGQEVTVLSRDIPVARLVPVEPLGGLADVRLPTPGAPQLADVPMPPPLTFDGDIVVVLRDERGDR